LFKIYNQYNELNLQQFLMCWKYLDCGMGLNEILIAGQINRWSKAKTANSYLAFQSCWTMMHGRIAINWTIQ